MGFESGYKQLITYKQSVMIFDGNGQFCKKWVDYHSRTYDQMIQAARSAKQCIAEGYQEKSLKSYIKLLGVTRGSYEELLEDYLDFGRGRGVEVRREIGGSARWERRGREGGGGEWILPVDSSSPSNTSLPLNAMVDLLIRTNFLLDRQIRSLEEKFIKEGGYTEKLFRERLKYRQNR